MNVVSSDPMNTKTKTPTQSRFGKQDPDSPWLVHITGVQSPVVLRACKCEGAVIDDHGDGTATLRLPENTPAGEGGLFWCEDDAGEFQIACVIPFPPGVSE